MHAIAHAVVLSGIALLRGSSWPSSTKRRWPWRASRRISLNP